MSDAQPGTALLWVGVGALASIRWAGGLTDRSERWVLPVSIAALGVAGVVPAFAHGVVALSAALLLLGGCSGAVDAAINAAAVRAGSDGTGVVSLAHGVFSLAVVAGSLAVAWLTPNDAGRAWALVAVGASLLVTALASTRLSLPIQPAAIVPDPGRGGWAWPLLVLGLLAALAYMVENAWQSWGAIQLHATVDAPLRIAALAPAVFALAAAGGRFGGHLLAGVSPGPIFGVASTVAAAGSALAALGHSPMWVLAGIAVAGLGTSVCAPTLIGLAGGLPPSDRSGAATGTVITLAYLGFALGPALIGLTAGASTLPTALLAVAVIAGGLAFASPLLTRLAHT